VGKAVTREKFLLERKKGVGGSDIAAVFNEGYGCKLRLWREKRDEVPDYPREHNDVMELGQVLEPFFAKKYGREAHRTVVTRKRPIIHPKYPELRVNIDREVMPAENGEDEGESGVLEIKSVGRGMFYKIKREGLPPDYILQLQHGIECMQTSWGAFAIGNRDNGDMVFWDVPKDETLAPVIVEKAREFWQDVLAGNMPKRLEPDDQRCQKCEYRKSCQGNALIQIEYNGEVEKDETLAPLVRELKERQALANQAEALLAETKEELKTTLGNRQAVEADGSTLYYRPQTSERGDFKELSSQYDALRQLLIAGSAGQPQMQAVLLNQYKPSSEYKKKIPSRPLRIF
jgi:predicted phage-related endonuclease